MQGEKVENVKMKRKMGENFIRNGVKYLKIASFCVSPARHLYKLGKDFEVGRGGMIFPLLQKFFISLCFHMYCRARKFFWIFGLVVQLGDFH